MTKPVTISILVILGFALFPFLSAWGGPGETILKPECVTRVLEEQKKAPMEGECELLPILYPTQDRYSAMQISVRCVTSPERNPTFGKGCLAIVDNKNKSIVFETPIHNSLVYYIGMVEIDGEPAILAQRSRKWELITGNNDNKTQYSW